MANFAEKSSPRNLDGKQLHQDKKPVASNQLAIQPKLLVAPSGDPLEHEADQAADRVVNLWQNGSLKAPGATPTPTQPLIQRRAVSAEAGAMQASPEVTQQIQAAKGGGQALPATLQPSLEAAFGMDFSGVRLHTDARADALNRELQAWAFTTGRDIFFREGAYQPGTVEGVRLLGHELGHVGQQGGHSANISLIQCQHIEQDGSAESQRHREWRRRLIDLGFRADHIGDLSTLDSFSLADIERYFRILDSLINQDRDRVGTGILRGWNYDQDDLGPTTRGGDAQYPTPLHYVQRLERLSFAASSGRHTASSSHSGYYEFRRASPQVRLAGQPVNVHPRALYFVAAAQVSMDNLARSAGIPIGGRQHYFVPGLSQRALNDVARSLNTLLGRMNPRRRTGRRRATPPDPATFSDALNDIISSLNSVTEGISMNRSQSPSSHPDADFNAWLDSPYGQSDTILNYLRNVRVPDEPAAFTSFTSNLIQILRSAPRSRYGGGAMDLHGTAHAMGLAIDMATTGESRAENRGIPESYMPFINYLIDNYKSEVLPAGTRAHAMHAFTHTQRYAISNLIRDYGSAVLKEMNSPEAENVTRPTREEITMDNQVYRRVRSSLSNLMTNLNRAVYLGRETFSRRFIQETNRPEFEEIRLELAGYLQNLRELTRSNIRTLSPVALQIQLHRIQQDLSHRIGRLLEILHDPNQPQTTRTHSGRRSPRRSTRSQLDGHLTAIQSILSSMESMIDAEWVGNSERRWEYRQMRALRELAEDSQFMRWARQAIEGEGGVYSQPDLYVLGIERVHSNPNHQNQFFGSHHWNIAPLDVIENPDAYRTALNSDIDTRTNNELIDIVNYIREFPRAWRFVVNDQILRAAIIGRVGNIFEQPDTQSE